MSQAVPFVKGFSEKERERRWKLAREFMQSNGLDALLFPGVGDTYLSNWVPGCTVLFPLKGDPVLLCFHNAYVLHLSPEAPKEKFPWIKDIRAGARGAMIVALLKERGLERGHVGVVGLSGISGAGPESGVSWATWNRVATRLPECDFEDVGKAWADSIFVSSEEELDNVRRAAQVLELACAAMLKAARAGVSELDVWAAVSQVESENGIVPRMSQFGSTPDTTGARPFWLHGLGEPRILQPGDIVETEIHASSREFTAQAQMCVAIPPVSDIDKRCAELARNAYEVGLRLLRPGKTFDEVVAAMEAEIDKGGAWHMTPLVHGLNYSPCHGPTGVNINRMPGFEFYPQFGASHNRGGDVVLKPGMAFELEPNACIGRNRINIGGTVLVTANEPEELNELPCRMRVAGE